MKLFKYRGSYNLHNNNIKKQNKGNYIVFV